MNATARASLEQSLQTIERSVVAAHPSLAGVLNTAEVGLLAAQLQVMIDIRALLITPEQVAA